MVYWYIVSTCINKPCTVKRELNASAKNIKPGQPAQADLSRNFSLLANFLDVQRPVHLTINSLPKDRKLDRSKLKTFADDKNKWE